MASGDNYGHQVHANILYNNNGFIYEFNKEYEAPISIQEIIQNSIVLKRGFNDNMIQEKYRMELSKYSQIAEIELRCLLEFIERQGLILEIRSMQLQEDRGKERPNNYKFVLYNNPDFNPLKRIDQSSHEDPNVLGYTEFNFTTMPYTDFLNVREVTSQFEEKENLETPVAHIDWTKFLTTGFKGAEIIERIIMCISAIGGRWFSVKDDCTDYAGSDKNWNKHIMSFNLITGLNTYSSVGLEIDDSQNDDSYNESQDTDVSSWESEGEESDNEEGDDEETMSQYSQPASVGPPLFFSDDFAKDLVGLVVSTFISEDEYGFRLKIIMQRHVKWCKNPTGPPPSLSDTDRNILSIVENKIIAQYGGEYFDTFLSDHGYPMTSENVEFIETQRGIFRKKVTSIVNNLQHYTDVVSSTGEIKDFTLGSSTSVTIISDLLKSDFIDNKKMVLHRLFDDISERIKRLREGPPSSVITKKKGNMKRKGTMKKFDLLKDYHLRSRKYPYIFRPRKTGGKTRIKKRATKKRGNKRATKKHSKKTSRKRKKQI